MGITVKGLGYRVLKLYQECKRIVVIMSLLKMLQQGLSLIALQSLAWKRGLDARV
jgi:hypothetical protein